MPPSSPLRHAPSLPLAPLSPPPLLTKGPTIALAMGEKGNITRLLAAKYGGYLTFAALSPERASAPGQPTIDQLKGLYSFRCIILYTVCAPSTPQEKSCLSYPFLLSRDCPAALFSSFLSPLFPLK